MLDRLIVFLFAAGVTAIPFDAIDGVKALGELGTECSFYFFASAIALWGLKGADTALFGNANVIPGKDKIKQIGVILLGITVISASWNATDIISNSFHNRSGLGKLMTSVMVIVYGLLLARLTCEVAPRRWYACIILPICISAALCIGFSALEAIDKAGINVPLYSTLNSALHAGFDHDVNAWDGSINLRLVEEWDKRLRSVSFEPPSFGNFTGLAWPWLLAAVFLTRGSRRIFHFCLLTLFTILIVGSQARTGWLLLAANLLSFGLLRSVFLPVHGRTSKAAVTITGSALLLALLSEVIYSTLSLDQFINEVVKGTSISDLSRLSFQVTAFKIFAASPLLGGGLGQFGFKVTSYMPSWGFLSPEIWPVIIYSNSPWPNTYSMYARLAAELGAIGLVGWITIWVTLIFSVQRGALAYLRLGWGIPAMAYPIIMTAIAILVTGVTTDTFRTPMIWITLGAGACFCGCSRQLFNGRSPVDPNHRLPGRIIEHDHEVRRPSQAIVLNSSAGFPAAQLSGHENPLS